MPKPAVATGRQLWRLNIAGRLAVVDQSRQITADRAHELLSVLVDGSKDSDPLEPISVEDLDAARAQAASH